MTPRFLSNYFPFLLAVAAVALLAFGLHHQTKALNRADLRESVLAEAQVLQARLESQIETSILISRGIASLLSRREELPQAEFSRLVESVTEGREDVVNVAWAPDLVITRVHPVGPNRAALGLDYREIPAQLEAVLKVRDTGQIAFVGPLQLVQGGTGFIMRVPVYDMGADVFEFQGILSTVFDLNGFLDRAGLMGEEQPVEVALAQLDGDGAALDVFYGNPAITTDDPITTDVHFPGSVWRLYAAPVGGWDVPAKRAFLQQVALMLLCAFILGPLFLLNRMALSRQQIIRNIQLADNRLHNFIQNFPGVFFTYIETEGEKDKILFVTEASRDIWNATPDDMINHPGIIWRTFDPNYLEGFHDAVAASRASNSTWHYTWQAILKDGTQRCLEGWGHPYPQPNGSIRWECFVVDVTEQYQRDVAFAEQAEVVRQAQKQESIGQLTGGMAHDFNNMLAVVRGNLEMLMEDLEAEGVSDDPRLEFVRDSILAAERGNDLTQKMLSFARKAPLDPEALNLNDVIQELEGWSGRTLPATMSVRKDLSAGIPLIRVDRSSTASAILNLMVNARDAMPNGGTLSIATRFETLTAQDMRSLRQDIPPGDYVVLSVSDTGTGISEENIAKIFDPFFTTKAPGAGSGLGLSMVHGFVAQSGGALRVETKAGQGTTFELFFRALDVPKTSFAEGPSAVNAPSSSQFSILLAEDDDDVRLMLERRLTRLGHRVTAAANGDKALALYDADPNLDLLITDVVMPGRLQGVELVQAIRQRAADFPIIVMTGYTDIALDDGTVLRPHDIRLSKPVARASLEQAIALTMERY